MKYKILFTLMIGLLGIEQSYASAVTAQSNDLAIAKECVADCSKYRYNNKNSTDGFNFSLFQQKLETQTTPDAAREWCKSQEELIANCEKVGSTCSYLKSWTPEFIYQSCHHKCKTILQATCTNIPAGAGETPTGQ